MTGGVDQTPNSSLTTILNAIIASDIFIVIKGPATGANKVSGINSIPARCVVFGIGEVDWETGSAGATTFTWGADSITENIYLHESSNYYHTVFHTDQVGCYRYWTNFPSASGTLTGTPLLIFDGNVTTENVGYFLGSYFRTSLGDAIEGLGNPGSPAYNVLQMRALGNNAIRPIRTQNDLLATPTGGVVGEIHVGTETFWFQDTTTLWRQVATVLQADVKLAQTAVASGASTTPQQTGTYRVAATVIVTQWTTPASFIARVTFTDENGVAQSETLPLWRAGTATDVGAVTAVDRFYGKEIIIRAKTNTAINISTQGTFTGSPIYDLISKIEKLA
jgi:hypothetical protein